MTVPPRRHPPAVYARRRAVAAACLLAVLGAIVWYVWFTPSAHDTTGKKSVSASHTEDPDASIVPTPLTSGSAGAPKTPSPIPGYLLIADRGNDRAILVGSAKKRLWMYPKQGTTPSFPFNFDDDTFFAKDYTQIITNEEDQQTLEIVSFPQGRVIWHYGHVNVKGSSPGYLNTPDDAYMLPNGNVSVADVYNCRILFISPDKRIVRQIGTTGACAHNPPHNLDSPNGDTPMPDGTTLVTEIQGSWIDAIDKSGKLLWSVQAPVRYPSDAQWLGGGKILLADYSTPGHVLIMTTGGKVLFKYGPPSGPAALDHPSLALMLPNGLIAVNDDYRDRVVIIDPRKHRIVWQYGHTDHPGTAPGYLNTPDGMDFLPFQTALSTPAIRTVVVHN